MVVKLNIDSNVPIHQATNRAPTKTILDADESEEEEDPAITNIDDVITDSEEEGEGGGGEKTSQGGGNDSVVPGHNVELDKLVLSAVHSPDSSPFKPTMESTTFDEEDELHDHSPSRAAGVLSAQSDLTNHVADHTVYVPVMEYEAQTLPSANKSRKSSHEVPVNRGYAILSETSFEQTQVRKLLIIILLWYCIL